jgi:proline dehydrogenase
VFLSIVKAGMTVTCFKRCYVAGTTEEELGKTLKKLRTRNIGFTADILGEHISEIWESKACMKDYIELAEWLDAFRGIFSVRNNPYGMSISVKPSHLGLCLDQEVFKQNLRMLVWNAKDSNVFVWVDAEEKETLAATYSAVLEVAALPECAGNIGTVVQSCHRDSAVWLNYFRVNNIPVRLCKGAYPDGDIKDEQKLREVYIGQAKNMLDAGAYIAIASHDSEIIDRLVSYIVGNNIPWDRFEFQMLLGVRMGYQENIAAQRFRMTTYVPFGDHYAAYLLRRFKKGLRNKSLLFLFTRNLYEGTRFALRKK